MSLRNKQRTFAVALLAGVLILAMASVAMAGDVTGRADLFLGMRSLGGNGWGSYGSQPEVGVMVEIHRDELPIELVAGVFDSKESWSDIGPLSAKAEVIELDFGGRKYLPSPQKDVSFYLGGGGAILFIENHIDIRGISYHDSDTGLGIWAEGGARINLNEKFNVGGLVRYTYGGFGMLGAGYGAGDFHIGVTGGLEF